MSNKDFIFPDLANFMGVTSASLQDRSKNFAVLSYEAAQGEITQTAFETDDVEKIVAGLVEVLASQGNPVGLVLFSALKEAADDDVNEESQMFETEEDEEHDEAENGTIGIDIYSQDDSGDDFGTDA